MNWNILLEIGLLFTVTQAISFRFPHRSRTFASYPLAKFTVLLSVDNLKYGNFRITSIFPTVNVLPFETKVIHWSLLFTFLTAQMEDMEPLIPAAVDDEPIFFVHQRGQFFGHNSRRRAESASRKYYESNISPNDFLG
ncbi:hypothetical protein D915_002866 [Fasciola hepatica]|uniref:Uncharacterized protein n=1 Tax=Fasciola hepatica TaxID=6192 RepID=A0A4E0RKA9_FASHE|nr:hypothetical protein D915_002866 [Fasciola hepatica]